MGGADGGDNAKMYANANQMLSDALCACPARACMSSSGASRGSVHV
jgi:hypothetical protein